jgi:hypothetical protein
VAQSRFRLARSCASSVAIDERALPDIRGPVVGAASRADARRSLADQTVEQHHRHRRLPPTSLTGRCGGHPARQGQVRERLRAREERAIARTELVSPTPPGWLS